MTSDIVAIKNLSIRIDEALLHKLHVLAERECRSVSGQVLILIRDAVRQYEQNYGEINL